MARQTTHVYVFIVALISVVNSDICEECACSYIYKQNTDFSELNVQCSYRHIGLEGHQLPDMVQSLDLSLNNLSTITFSPLFQSKTMTNLLLHSNLITNISSDAFHLPELRKLDLSYNFLKHIEQDIFKNIRKLEYLNLANNRITTFTKMTFHPLSALQEIVLDYNNIGPSLKDNNLFDRSGYGLTNKIKAISITGINLNTVNDNFFVDAYDIRKIILSNNHLTSTFKLPYTLEYLDLSDNPIGEIESDDFDDVPALKILKLNNLAIKEVPDYAFYSLSSLTHLELKSNLNLTSFSNVTFGKQVMVDTYDFTVQSISLKGSRLRSLDKSLSVLFELLTRLDLQGNPWHCDCNIVWLKRLQIPEKDYINFRCNTPKPLHDARIFDLNEKYFVCPPHRHVVSSALIIIIVCIVLAIIALWLFVFVPRNASRNDWLTQMYAPAAAYTVLTPNAFVRREIE